MSLEEVPLAGGFVVKKIKNSFSVKRTALIALCVALAVILVALVAGTIYMEYMLNLINKNPDDSTMSSDEYQDFINNETEPSNPDFTGETIDPDDVVWVPNTEPVEPKEHIINIMLIGQDRRPGEARSRSDVMILCTVNTQTRELTVTSFMRDMYVPIPGYQDNRINVCYKLGGMKLLDKCLETNFGIHVDGNFEVDFDGFIDIIDLVGGVEIELTKSEANHLISNGHKVRTGKNLLNGEAALTYARNRSTGNGDFSRTERQRKIVSALFEKCKSMNLVQLQNLMTKALPMLTTDLSNREILKLLLDVLPVLGNLKVNTQRLPADGTFKYATIRGMSVLVPDLEANREILKKYMGNSLVPAS